MGGNVSDRSRSSELGRQEHQPVLDTERSFLDADQRAADADQTSSDADRTWSEQDDADAASDQIAAERDQASADQVQPVDADAATVRVYETSRLAREVSSISRQMTHIERGRTARVRIDTATHRDVTAAARDEAARRRDLQSRALDRSVDGSDEPVRKKLERIRARGATDRGRAAADRVRAATDRVRAAQDRSEAARVRSNLEAELHTAHLDDLTGAFRRDMGTLVLRNEIEHARREDGRFVVAFVDVDGLKRLNDREGHAAGDRVLQAVVSTLRSNLRSFDPIVRFGGDEFVCGLGGVDLVDVQTRFDAICLAIRAEVGVGISVGLAVLAADETVDRLIARADAALLVAKRGRPDL